MTQAQAHHDSHAAAGTLHAHVSPLWQLALILFALLFLTAMTVAVTMIDLGSANIVIALVIAAVKGILVLLYFMHLRYESPFNALVIVVALLFVTLMIAFTLIDTHQYSSTLIPPGSVGNVQ